MFIGINGWGWYFTILGAISRIVKKKHSQKKRLFWSFLGCRVFSSLKRQMLESWTFWVNTWVPVLEKYITVQVHDHMGWQWNAESLRIFDSSNLPETYERDKVILIEAWEITWLCFLQNEQADITKLVTNDYKRIKKKCIISIIVICMSAICEPVVKTESEKHMRSQCVEADVGPNPKSTKAENHEFAVGIQKRVVGPPPHFEKHQLESQKKLIAQKS